MKYIFLTIKIVVFTNLFIYTGRAKYVYREIKINSTLWVDHIFTVVFFIHDQNVHLQISAFQRAYQASIYINLVKQAGSCSGSLSKDDPRPQRCGIVGQCFWAGNSLYGLWIQIFQYTFLELDVITTLYIPRYVFQTLCTF